MLFSIPGTPKPLLRHSRSKNKDSPSVVDRFKTQPITFSPDVTAATEPSKEGYSLTQSKSIANVLDRDDDGKNFSNLYTIRIKSWANIRFVCATSRFETFCQGIVSIQILVS